MHFPCHMDYFNYVNIPTCNSHHNINLKEEEIITSNDMHSKIHTRQLELKVVLRHHSRGAISIGRIFLRLDVEEEERLQSLNNIIKLHKCI